MQEHPLGQHPAITTRHGVQTNERQRILEIQFDSNAEKGLMDRKTIASKYMYIKCMQYT